MVMIEKLLRILLQKCDEEGERKAWGTVLTLCLRKLRVWVAN